MRIASLLPSATEIVCSLGLEEDLVAVTHECDYPASVRIKPVLTRSVLSEASSGVEVDRHIRELVHQGSSIYALDADLLSALHPPPSQRGAEPLAGWGRRLSSCPSNRRVWRTSSRTSSTSAAWSAGRM